MLIDMGMMYRSYAICLICELYLIVKGELFDGNEDATRIFSDCRCNGRLSNQQSWLVSCKPC